MIADAMERGIRNFIIGIGGEAQQMMVELECLRHLAINFPMKMDRMSAKADRLLERVSSIIIEKANPILKECNFHIACDVTNPLCGKNGATYILWSAKKVSHRK